MERLRGAICITLWKTTRAAISSLEATMLLDTGQVFTSRSGTLKIDSDVSMA